MTQVRLSLKDSQFLPKYATPGSAGADLVAAINAAIIVDAGGTVKIPCGFSLELPEGLEAQIRPRSGLAAKHGLTVLNSPGTIDSDYRGEICVLLHNTSAAPFTIEPLMRVAQMVIAPYVKAKLQPTEEDLTTSSRGAKGFGSSGM